MKRFGDISKSPLYAAAEAGSEEKVTQIVHACTPAELNKQEGVFHGGRTPLAIACSKGRVGVVRVLLGCGEVNVNCRDNNHSTPLHNACRAPEYRRANVVRALLGHERIDVNVEDLRGMSPLQVAMRESASDIVELLMDRWDVRFGMAEFHHYSMREMTIPAHLRIAWLFLRRPDLDVNYIDNRASSAFLKACLECGYGKSYKADYRVAMVRLLLQRDDLLVSYDAVRYLTHRGPFEYREFVAPVVLRRTRLLGRRMKLPDYKTPKPIDARRGRRGVWIRKRSHQWKGWQSYHE